MALTPPQTWTGTLLSVAADTYSRVRFYGEAGLTLPSFHHTCNANHLTEDVVLDGGDAGFAFWAHTNAGQPQLYLRRGEDPNWAWADTTAGASNEWTEAADQQGGPTHWWRLVAHLWHYQYSGGAWRYIGPKTLQPVQLWGRVPYLGNEFCNHDGASEVCGPAGADRGWVPHAVSLQQCGRFGGPVPWLVPEWEYTIARIDLGNCVLYRAVT